MSSENTIPITVAPSCDDAGLADHSHVVCGTDFTNAGRDASDVAAEIAKARGEPLALVHVVNEPARGSLPNELRESLALFERKQLQDEMQRLTSRGAMVIQLLRTGAPFEVLVQAAREPFARLLVLSCGQRKGQSGLLGSVVEHVAESTPIPTLVVRQPAPLLTWLREKRSLRIFVAADLTPASEAAIKWAIELQALGRCVFTIAHVESDPPRDVDLTTTPALASTVARLQRMAARYFREYLKVLLRGEKARVHIVSGWGRSDAHLIHLAQEERADLIVTGTHQRHGFGRALHHSVSRGLLHYAPMNVACVPASGSRSLHENRSTY